MGSDVLQHSQSTIDENCLSSDEFRAGHQGQSHFGNVFRSRDSAEEVARGEVRLVDLVSIVPLSIHNSRSYRVQPNERGQRPRECLCQRDHSRFETVYGIELPNPLTPVFEAILMMHPLCWASMTLAAVSSQQSWAGWLAAGV